METEPVPWSWEEALKKESEAAGVGVINHAPLSEFWPKLQMVGAVAEVRTDQVRALAENNNSERPDDLIPTFYNVEVIQVAGYYAKVRFLGYSEDHEAGENLIWIHSKNLKEICAHKKQGVVGIPPWAIAPDSSVEVLSRLFNAMIGKFSVNPLIEILVENSLKSPWKVGKQVETLDKDCVSQMRFGYIGKTLGRRVFVHYWNAASGKHKDGYWVHADSDMLKPQGWSATVGVNISAPKSVKPSQLSVEELGIVLPEFEIRPLMIFEMVNPIRSNELALGQVVEVLKYGFFKCTIISPVVVDDLNSYANGKNEFFFHVSSPWIFPIGTAQTYGFGRDLPRSTEVSPFSIPLPIPPKSLEGPAKFTRGMFVEVVDSHVTDLVCPARVTKLLGPYVVLIRFIGWSSEYDQWKPLDSMDIFPIGWCELVGHPLTPAGDMAEESEDDVDLKEFTPAPEVPSTSSGIVSSDLQKSSKSRRKSIPKKLVVEVTQVPVKNSPRPRKPTGKRKSRVKDSDESEEEEIPVSSGKAKLSQGRRSILITPPKRPVPDGTRRSSRARAAPEFFGENVQRRNSRNTYLE